jgi:hypothetical protein
MRLRLLNLANMLVYILLHSHVGSRHVCLHFTTLSRDCVKGVGMRLRARSLTLAVIFVYI